MTGKEFLIRDETAFKLRGKMNRCQGLNSLWCVKFTGEQYNENGELTNESTYEFFLEDNHVKNMIDGLTA